MNNNSNNTNKDIYLKSRLDTILSILEKHKLGSSLDSEVSNFFRINKKFGSKDRRSISNILFFYIRNRSYIDYWKDHIINLIDKDENKYCYKYISLFISKIMQDNLSDKDFLSVVYEYDFLSKDVIDCIVDNYINILSYKLLLKDADEEYESIRYSLPLWLLKKIKTYYKDYYDKLLESFLVRADLIIRVNTHLISSKKLLNIFQSKSIECSEISNRGISLKSTVNVSNTSEFKKGYFDIQDLGSQLICDKINLDPGSLVLDYCSGSGGKTLNLASRYYGNGIKFFCYDIRESILEELKTRALRSKLSSFIQCCDETNITYNVDTLILDLPCSGTGTLRRSSYIKWELTEKKLEDILKLQFDIVKKALPFLKKGGYLYYITCSILNDENEFQITKLMKSFSLELIEEFKTNPYLNNADGMYLAILKKI